VDENLLHDLQPDIIITQDLCQVCSPSAMKCRKQVLDKKPELLWMTPKSLSRIEDNIRALGRCDRLRTPR
jgi:iron complex transport system substrate-binding protein